jgi:3D-(3,5/4)-trihydroxycyclohexane-1,2-dione acylhydrolase (decyclizing)
MRAAQRPVIIAGGGVHYSQAEAALAAFAERHRVPVVETVNGRASLPHAHPALVGPLGVLGSDEANVVAAQADVVIAIGTRLQDFSTGSWSLFQDEGLKIVAINAARFDAIKHTAIPVVADARAALEVLEDVLEGWRTPDAWAATALQQRAAWDTAVEARTRASNTAPTSYAQAVGAVNRAARAGDLVLTAAGGLPGEIDMNWRSTGLGDVDIEYGYSCMGYEVAGGWGAKIAKPDREVFVMVGDGSYLLMNTDILSSVMTGHKLIVVICDNGGFAVIDRLQRATGNESFNNLFSDCRKVREVQVDFAAHARAMGALAEHVGSIAELDAALVRARAADRTTVISIAVDKYGWSPNSAWWEVGVPEVSARTKVLEAAARWQQGREKQRRGV